MGSIIPDLIAEIDDTDFCVLVFSPDDTATIRDARHPAVRDNVLFELGLSIGRVGAARSFFLVPDDTPDLHLPTDLSGTTTGCYQAGRPDGNWQAGVARRADAEEIVCSGRTHGSLVNGRRHFRSVRAGSNRHEAMLVFGCDGF